MHKAAECYDGGPGGRGIWGSKQQNSSLLLIPLGACVTSQEMAGGWVLWRMEATKGGAE